MKKYIVYIIALLAVTTFSFTQAFDGLTVIAIGGLDDCNGSDVSANIDCTQLAGNQQTCTEKYKTVTDTQAVKDVISELKNKCTADGCENVLNNPTPKAFETHCTKLTGGEVDPEEQLRSLR